MPQEWPTYSNLLSNQSCCIQILKVQQLRILYFHTQWRMRLMLMIRTLLHAILTNIVVIIYMKSQSYFGMNLYQMIAFLWKQSWKNSKRDGKNHIITFLCALVILLRYVLATLKHSHHFSTHESVPCDNIILCH